MGNHHDILIRTKMQQFSKCRFVESKQRYEAVCSGIKNIGYGKSEKEANEMLRKIVENTVYQRPELENLNDHEAAREKKESKMPVSAVTNNYNVQGMIVTGTVGTMQNVSVSVHQAIMNIQSHNQELGGQLEKFATAVEKSDELTEEAKVEILDHSKTIADQVELPKERRLAHRAKNAVKETAELVKGCAALKSIWDVAEPLVRAHLGI
jgi:hypothetical protein